MLDGRMEAPTPTTTATAKRPQRGDELELTVESLAYGGAGVARLDRYVVFVQEAIPGDRVKASVTNNVRPSPSARITEAAADPGR